MRVGQVLAAFRRRWIPTLICLILTVGLVLFARQLVDQRYQASANIVLLPPASALERNANPFMQLGGLSEAVAMLAIAISDQHTLEAVHAVSPTAQVSIRSAPDSSAPLLIVTATDTDPARSVQVLQLMLSQIPERLDELQSDAGVAANNRLTSSVLTHDEQASPTGSDQFRAVIVAAVAGLVLTAVVVALLDVFLLRRAARKSGKRTPVSRTPHARERGGSSAAEVAIADRGHAPIPNVGRAPVRPPGVHFPRRH